MLHDEEQESQQHTRDVDRLEAALSDRARELRELRAELERRSVLIRDVTTRWEALPQATHAPDPTSSATDSAKLVAERDAAVARALDAEVAAMEARFRVDELAGHLAGAGAQPVDQSAELAQRDGAVRGLRSRLAETEDARDHAEARLMLAEQDLEDARARVDALRRDAFEIGERLEVEALQARTAAGDLARARGELLGLGHRADEAERALQASRDELTAVRAMDEQLQKRVSLALAERDAARGVIELGRAERDAALAEASRLRDQVASLRAEVAERDADLAMVRNNHSDAAPSRDRAVALHAALVDARRGLQELTAWLAGAGPGAGLAGTTSFELDAPHGGPGSGARDDETVPGIPLDMQGAHSGRVTVVQALQDELAERDAQVRTLEARIADLQRRSGLS